MAQAGPYERPVLLDRERHRPAREAGSGELHLVSMHLASLSNLQRLVDRMARRKQAMPPAPQPGA
jgi:hypothetical protein